MKEMENFYSDLQVQCLIFLPIAPQLMEIQISIQISKVMLYSLKGEKIKGI